MLDADEILRTRKQSTLTLTKELAQSVNEVIRKLPKNTAINALYFKKSELWADFLKTLTPVQRSSITRAFLSISTRGRTIDDVSKKSLESLIGWKATKTTAAFIYVCFRLDQSNKEKEMCDELNHVAIRIL